MLDAFGGGGVGRTVINLANYLVERHDVELISLFRQRDEPRFAIDPRVRLVVLRDRRVSSSRVAAFLAGRRSRLRPLAREAGMNLLTDLLLWRKLRRIRHGILLSVRPSLHVAATTYAPAGVVRVGQEHQNFRRRQRHQRQAAVMTAVVPRLDALAVLTRADARDYRSLTGGASTEVLHLPNALPWPVADEPLPLREKVVVTAGRLTEQKGYDRLVPAWVAVAARHPDWQLHIYGAGPQRDQLEAMVRGLHLEAQVKLCGYTLDIRAAFATASIYALPSRFEGFGMVLIEAMSQGLPLVAMNCPRGPGEIVRDGSNGRLVPRGDIDAFVGAVNTLIEDDELRRRLGRQAHEDARTYDRESIGRRWDELFDRLLARRPA